MSSKTTQVHSTNIQPLVHLSANCALYLVVGPFILVYHNSIMSWTTTQEPGDMSPSKGGRLIKENGSSIVNTSKRGFVIFTPLHGSPPGLYTPYYSLLTGSTLSPNAIFRASTLL